MKAETWVLASKFVGQPKDSDFRLEEEELPELQDGDILCDAVYLSVDPYMRAFDIPVDKIITGEQVARVTESKHVDYPVGCFVQLDCGWRARTVVNPEKAPKRVGLARVPEIDNLEPSVFLGVLGMPGRTAYAGLLGICKPQEGETVVVSTAGGAVGSAVGQIAKIKGCKVIGFTGSDAKCDWVKSLGFDHVFNYKKTDVDKALKQAAPDGVDCYFDNVGGEFASKVLQHMNVFGRITVCGSTSTYNELEQPNLPFPFITILEKHLIVEGFEVYLDKWKPKVTECKAQMMQWLKEGKVKYKETVREGFNKMPQTFMAMLKGENIGKMIVKV